MKLDEKRPVQTSKKLGWTKPLLESWRDELDHYAKRTRALLPEEPDYPHWYNERASIGFVAQAARSLSDKSVVLEEFLQTKMPRKGAPVAGRGDLWFSLGNKRACYIEAKHVWLSMDGTAQKPSLVVRALGHAKDAVEGARAASEPPVRSMTTWLTGMFVTAYCTEQRWVKHRPPNFDERLQRWLGVALASARLPNQPAAEALWLPSPVGREPTAKWPTFSDRSGANPLVAPAFLLVLSEVI